MGRIGQVSRHAADEPTGLGAVGLEQHRGQAGRGGLAVGTRDDKIAAFVQQARTEQLRERNIRLGAAFQQPLDLGMTAGGDVTDDDEVGLQPGEAFGGPAFEDVDARARAGGRTSAGRSRCRSP